MIIKQPVRHIVTSMNKYKVLKLNMTMYWIVIMYLIHIVQPLKMSDKLKQNMQMATLEGKLL